MDDIFQIFQDKLAKNGFPEEIVWVHERQVHLTKEKLFIYTSNGFASNKQVKDIFNKYRKKFDCGATLMLVAENDNQSYCTLLMDSFGSDTELEIQPSIYLWVSEPYVERIGFVTNPIKWFFTKRKTHQLSSLDYAFQIQQAHT